ncbi:MAG: single-stranded-DNA-specific exonuclease RecJ [Candidatus Berkelbacteria bacterium]|nr:single-stranded-DNA-specific exonuclease RecJ [Candidatus Berkelbacteria bacterium]
MVKHWVLPKRVPQKFIRGFPEHSPVILQLLYNRGVRTKKEIEEFLNPDWGRDLYDPFLMKGMREVAGRLKKTINKKEKIAIFGHFDVDGITSTALFYLVFKKLGIVPRVYIPDREEGYGLTKEAVEKLAKDKIKLILTADCGISSAREVELAKKLKMDVIITDHHEIPKVLPNTKYILNPNQKGCSYPFKELAGVGVAYKLVYALSKIFPQKLSELYIKWMVDLVGLGTICDIVPLVSENRLFAKFGLIVLNKTKKIGLLNLCQKVGLKPGNIDAYSISYIIGPRLNAPGRMDHANTAFYLLITQNRQRSKKLTAILDKNNQERQEILRKALSEAKQEIKKKNLDKNKLILLSRKDWPSGIVGLIAGKLKDEYSRPILVLSMGEKHAKGSARSIDAFHITDILSQCSDYLVKFGGHKRAAGFSVLNKKIDLLKKELIRLAESRLTDDDLKPKINIDAVIDLSEINWDLQEQLEKFEPCGFENRKPVFLAKKVKIESIKKVGKQANHLKMKLSGFDGIFFGGVEHFPQLKAQDLIDLVFYLDVDDWRSERKLQLKIVDIKSLDTKF